MQYLIYKITNKIDGKFYIGKHQTENIDDGYMGSGKRLELAINKYMKENFEKEILFVFDAEEEMNAKEAEIVTEEFCLRNDTYNLCVGGKGGWSFVNRSGKNLRTGMVHSKESKRKSGDGMRGKSHSEETKQKISNMNKLTNKSRREKVSSAFKGKPKSEEHKRKIAESVKKRHLEKKSRV